MISTATKEKEERGRCYGFLYEQKKEGIILISDSVTFVSP